MEGALAESITDIIALARARLTQVQAAEDIGPDRAVISI